MLNLLFVCSRNQWRSPTAEKIFSGRSDIHVRSAGTASSARTKCSAKMIEWADIIVVMEKKHKQVLQQRFSSEMSDTTVYILDIPDEYHFMDEELINILQSSVKPILEKYC